MERTSQRNWRPSDIVPNQLWWKRRSCHPLHLGPGLRRSSEGWTSVEATVVPWRISAWRWLLKNAVSRDSNSSTKNWDWTINIHKQPFSEHVEKSPDNIFFRMTMAISAIWGVSIFRHSHMATWLRLKMLGKHWKARTIPWCSLLILLFGWKQIHKIPWSIIDMVFWWQC